MARLGALVGSLCALVVALGGCHGRRLPHGPPAPGDAGTAGDASVPGDSGAANDPRVEIEFHVYPSRQLDLLFVVDVAPGMEQLQAKLIAQIPVFMNLLRQTPGTTTAEPGLPDLHVGVITTDTGAGSFDMPDLGCPLGGDRGRLRVMPGAACNFGGTSVTTDGRRFLATSNDQRQKNYPGDISDAIACLIPLDQAGCRFASPLQAIRRALDPQNPPPGNQGFLRRGAFLAIVVVTNQDDCSLPDGSKLLDPAQVSISDPLGPFSTFRCNEFGHLCFDVDRWVSPSREQARTYDSCISNEESSDQLTKLTDEVAFLRGLKNDTSRISVTAIAGPVSPYTVALQPRTVPPGVSEDQPLVLPSCAVNAGEAGQPAVRLSQWTQSFGRTGVFQTMCGGSFAASLMPIATSLGTLDTTFCVGGDLRDANPATPALDPDCLVDDGEVAADGTVPARSPVPACSADGDIAPCWRRVDDPSCKRGFAFSVQRPAALTSEHFIGASCAACPPGFTAPGCP